MKNNDHNKVILAILNSMKFDADKIEAYLMEQTALHDSQFLRDLVLSQLDQLVPYVPNKERFLRIDNTAENSDLLIQICCALQGLYRKYLSHDAKDTEKASVDRFIGNMALQTSEMENIGNVLMALESLIFITAFPGIPAVAILLVSGAVKSSNLPLSILALLVSFLVAPFFHHYVKNFREKVETGEQLYSTVGTVSALFEKKQKIPALPCLSGNRPQFA